MTGELLADDDFAGRSYSRFGLGEGIGLYFTTDPSPIIPSQIGGLEWKLLLGDGNLNNFPGNSGVGHYTCATSGAYWGYPYYTFLKLEILTGPSAGEGPIRTFLEIVPWGAYMEKMPGTDVGHKQGYFSVGFWGHPYLLPKDVSFSNLKAYEGSCEADADGYFASNDKELHPEGPWGEIGSGNITTGCRVEIDDTISELNTDSNWAEGNFKWNIPWRIGYGGQDIADICMMLHHVYSKDNSGKAYIKKSAGPYSKTVYEPDGSLTPSSQLDLFW